MATFTVGHTAWRSHLFSLAALLALLLLPRASLSDTSTLDCSDDEDNDGLPEYSGTPVCSHQDRQALLRFKAAVSSDPNSALSNWTGSNCCEWNGVTCDNTTNRVVRLKLPNEGLIGKLPARLSALSALLVLILDNNDFSGGIPSKYGKFTRLQRLCISSNPSLSGSIPSSFRHLTSLQLMDLRSNSLSGSLPSSFGSLSSLQVLHLYGNKISGHIPKSFGMLSQLYDADLGNNRFSGKIPDEFGYALSSLIFLYLENNRITGLPADLHNLTSMQWIDLSFNPIKDSDSVAGIATMPLISQIELDSCNITGPFPSWVSRLPQPDISRISDEVTPSLDLANNIITGPIPAAVGNLTNLQSLSLENNKLTGSIPASFANLQSLQRFNVSYNDLTGKIPQVSPFTGFPVSSYKPGNAGLCGTPLPACSK